MTLLQQLQQLQGLSLGDMKNLTLKKSTEMAQSASSFGSADTGSLKKRPSMGVAVIPQTISAKPGTAPADYYGSDQHSRYNSLAVQMGAMQNSQSSIKIPGKSTLNKNVRPATAQDQWQDSSVTSLDDIPSANQQTFIVNDPTMSSLNKNSTIRSAGSDDPVDIPPPISSPGKKTGTIRLTRDNKPLQVSNSNGSIKQARPGISDASLSDDERGGSRESVTSSVDGGKRYSTISKKLDDLMLKPPIKSPLGKSSKESIPDEMLPPPPRNDLPPPPLPSMNTKPGQLSNPPSPQMRNLNSPSIIDLALFYARPLPDTFHASDEKLQRDLSMFASVSDIFRARAALNPNQVALTIVDQKSKESTLTYGKMNGRAENIAMFIRGKLAKETANVEDAKLGLFYPSGDVDEFLTAFLACNYANVPAVLLPFDYQNRDDMYAKMVRTLSVSKCRFVMTTEDVVKQINKDLHDKNSKIPDYIAKEVNWWVTDDIKTYNNKKNPFEPARLDLKQPSFIEYTRSDDEAVEISYESVFQQCLMMRCLQNISHADIFYTELDCRGSFGLIHILLLAIISGSSIVSVPQTYLYSDADALWLGDLSTRKITVAFTREPKLVSLIGYMKSLTPEQLAKMIKQDSVAFTTLKPKSASNLSLGLRYLFINYSGANVRPSPSVLCKAFVSICRQLNYTHQAEIIPLITLGECGNLALSFRSQYDPDIGGIELGISIADLSDNIVIIANEGNTVENPLHKLDSNISRLVDCGFLLPTADFVVVNPFTGRPCDKSEVGEIWLSAPWLPFAEQSTRLRKLNIIGSYIRSEWNDKLFLPTKVIGFASHNDRLFVCGALGERFGDMAHMHSHKDVKFFYNDDIKRLILESVPRVTSFCSFKTFLCDDEFLAVITEMNADVAPQEADILVNAISDLFFVWNFVHPFAIIICKPGAVKRDRDGFIDEGLMRMAFESGSLNPVAIKFDVQRSSKYLAGLPKSEREAIMASSGLLNQPAPRQSKAQICDGNTISNIGQGVGASDNEAKQNLLEFSCISAILAWRAQQMPKSYAFISLDPNGRPSKTYDFGKLGRKIARLTNNFLKRGLRCGDVVILLYTNSLEYVVAVHTCLYMGLTIVLFPCHDDASAYNENDIYLLLKLNEKFKPARLLINNFTEEWIRSPPIQLVIKTLGQQNPEFAKLPDLLNTTRTVNSKKCAVNNTVIVATIDSFSTNPGRFPIIQVARRGNEDFECFFIAHETLAAQCVMLKEFYDTGRDAVLLSCFDHTYGLGFLNSAVYGIFVGCTTTLLKFNDVKHSTKVWMEVVNKYPVKDTFIPNIIFENMLKEHGQQMATDIMKCERLRLVVTTNGISRPNNAMLSPKQLTAMETLLGKLRIQFSYVPKTHPVIASRAYQREPHLTVSISMAALRRGKIEYTEHGTPGSIQLTECGRIMPCTTVVIVKPGTSLLCSSQEFGEIWLSSPACADASSTITRAGESTATNTNLELQVRGFDDMDPVAAQELDSSIFTRTGDIGFLYETEVTAYVNTTFAQKVPSKVLFLLGSQQDMIELDSLERGNVPRKMFYFTVDIEMIIENSSPDIVRNSTIVFTQTRESGKCIVALLELKQGRNPMNALTMIMNAVVEQHQLALGAIGFLPDSPDHPISSVPYYNKSHIRHILRQSYEAQSLPLIYHQHLLN